LCEEIGVDPNADNPNSNRDLRARLVKRIRQAAKHFPQYGVPRAVALTLEPWTIENGMLTPTLKLKRRVIRARYQDDINALYDDQRA
jgi:long-chain acyl-CoA synthetase